MRAAVAAALDEGKMFGVLNGPRELADLLGDGRIAEPLSEPRYHNVEMLKRQAPGALRRAA